VETLGALGFSADEAQLYRTLVALGSSRLDDLAHRCGLTQATATEVTVALEQRGLMAQSATDADRWVAAPPGVALRVLLNERRHQLDQAELTAAQLAEVHRTDAASDVQDLVEVVVGTSAVAQRFHQLQLGAVEEVAIFVTDQPAAVTSEANEAEDVATARGVRYRIVLERNVLETEPQENLVDVLRREQQVRVVERVPTKLIIADGRTAMVPLDSEGGDPAALVVHAGGLVESLVALFDAVWRDAWPLVLATPDADEVVQDEPGPDALDLQVLALLIAGASDARVAKQLDMGLRTVQRRVRSLMDATRATTRIQLGWAACERGWVTRS
jgi:sugar-specific transcriptional regulator TrmB